MSEVRRTEFAPDPALTRPDGKSRNGTAAIGARPHSNRHAAQEANRIKPIARSNSHQTDRFEQPLAAKKKPRTRRGDGYTGGAASAASCLDRLRPFQTRRSPSYSSSGFAQKATSRPEYREHHARCTTGADGRSCTRGRIASRSIAQSSPRCGPVRKWR